MIVLQAHKEVWGNKHLIFLLHKKQSRNFTSAFFFFPVLNFLYERTMERRITICKARHFFLKI